MARDFGAPRIPLLCAEGRRFGGVLRGEPSDRRVSNPRRPPPGLRSGGVRCGSGIDNATFGVTLNWNEKYHLLAASRSRRFREIGE
jgi:hypothetical protein